MSVLRAKISAWGIPDEVYEDKIRMAQAAGFKLELRKNKEEKWEKWISDERINRFAREKDSLGVKRSF